MPTDPSSPVERPQMPGEAPQILLAVADAAVAWWTMKRPLAWTLARHLAHATINAATAEERRLAAAVAAWCEIQQGRCDREDAHV